jgi:opacity protein-like surface antigen
MSVPALSILLVSREAKMIRIIMILAILVGVLVPAGSACAEEGQGTFRFGSRGIIVSAERLIPLTSYESVKTTQSDGSSETKSDLSLGLLSNAPYTAFGTFYNLPRIAFDWIPVHNLTLGGAIWLYTELTASDSRSPAGSSSTSTDQPKVTYWGFAPRVGYVVPLSDVLSLWPRIGVEYHNVSASSVNGSVSPSVDQFAIDTEVMLVISPWNHFGFTVGPTIDIPVTGKSTSAAATGTGTTGTATATNFDSTMFQVGVSAGMLGHF